MFPELGASIKKRKTGSSLSRRNATKARKALKDRFKRTLTQVGGQSLSITIPIEYLEELGWQKGQELLVIHSSRNGMTCAQTTSSNYDRHTSQVFHK